MNTLRNLVRITPKRNQIKTISVYRYTHNTNNTEVIKSEETPRGPREITPITHLREQPLYPLQEEDDALPHWPNNTNPFTGEIGGPKGLEPTRYGDWERKGICMDF